MIEQLTTEIEKKLPSTEESQRLFHGRGQCFPSYEDLTIDWWNPVIMITLYRERVEPWLQTLVSYLRQKIPESTAVVVQERYDKGCPSRLLYGSIPEDVCALENGLKYRLDFSGAQNIGFFPDMKCARSYVKRASRGKNVLNLFAYTCSFSVAAIAGGAGQVVNLDMNRNSLKVGRLNHQLNQLDLRRASFLPLELFRSFSRLRKLAPFELIICDPPAEQGRSFSAERDWPKLVRKVPELLGPDGLMLCCLSNPHISNADLLDLFAREQPGARLTQTVKADADFPERLPDIGSRALLFQF